jgi:hypothetical protein
MMLLADMLVHKDFNARMQEVGGTFRKKAGITFKVHQAGIVAPDVEMAADLLEAQGFGPFMIAAGTLPRWNERGAEGRFRGKMGVAYHDGIELELLEPGEGSDFYRRYVDPEGRPVIQHIGFLTHAVDEWAERLSEMGCPLWVRGRIGVGPLSIDFAYMDSVRDAGTILEFIGYRFAGIPARPVAGIMRAAAWLQKKTGKRCIDFG